MGKRGFLGDEEDNDISAAADAAIVDVMAAASPDSAADDLERRCIQSQLERVNAITL